MALLKLSTTVVVFLSSFILQSSAEDTVSLFLPGFPSSLKATSVVASIIDGNSQVRTYAIACPSSDAYCSLPTPFTLVQGAHTLAYTVTKADTSCRMSCTYDAPVTGHCHAEVTAPNSRGTLDNDIGANLSWAIASITAGQSFLDQTLVTGPISQLTQPTPFPSNPPFPGLFTTTEQFSESDMWGWDPSATSRQQLFPPLSTSGDDGGSGTASSVVTDATTEAAGVVSSSTTVRSGTTSANSAQGSAMANAQSTSSSRAAAAMEMVDMTSVGGVIVAAAAVVIAAL